MNFQKSVLGIELGSTRIKAVLLDENHIPAASGSFSWENRLENGIWTYSLDDAVKGLRECYSSLREDVKAKYNVELASVGAIGVSGMMHGYLPFDKDGNQLSVFRTWRNTITAEAAEKLTKEFDFNVPQRWSIAHLYREILNGSEHVKDIAYLTTLAGYIHWRLCGEKNMGIGEASGMFPIDSRKLDYDQAMLDKFKALTGIDLRDILPKVLPAGTVAGRLTEEGAKLLDVTGTLQPGIPLAPCEGDAGTGMTATNSVRAGTGNVSAGTSDFAMIVTDKPLGVHVEIDMVTTPSGLPVAMVHCNNCTGDIDQWVGLFSDFARLIGADISKPKLYDLLYESALNGDADCGGLMNYNYLSGEGITALDKGCPIFMREPSSKLNIANLFRTLLMSTLATLKIGLDILTETEHITVDKLFAHGGLFKTPIVGQRFLSAAAGVPVIAAETAGEGGPYGMALLADYMLNKNANETLEDYLDNKIFDKVHTVTVTATQEDIKSFSSFLKKYTSLLPVERTASDLI